ncbi:unnamed protein product [Ranitomeya imitator]|uniref:Amine oxidase n=1 Tax=Ranitomeya imitator TaxID=111125 RepID=A0ABN9LFU0_9NEOB|nr:unnamed protein product [Ranitomeya imitator]
MLYLTWTKEDLNPGEKQWLFVYFGSHSEPEIKEFVVGPLPNPTYRNDVTLQRYKSKLLYHRRPVIGSEYNQIRKHFLFKEYSKAKSFLKEVLGYNESNIESLTALTGAPRGFVSGERKTWFGIFFNTQGSGYFLHPTGLEILLNHKDLNYSKWSVERVFYNGEYFESLSKLEEKYKKGHLKVVKLKMPHLENNIASLKSPKSSVSDIPMQYEPQGARYSVKNNQVLFQHWSFAFGINLVRGIDCPYFATFIDTHYLLDSDSSVLNKGSICIFELNSGIPLRRHFSSLGSSYYGGLANTVLIIRTIASIGNYDYVFDFMFYQNGAIESKVHATGYISTTFFTDAGLQHGNRVGPHTLGTIHTHFINYKVDMDVGGYGSTIG